MSPRCTKAGDEGTGKDERQGEEGQQLESKERSEKDQGKE